MKRFCITTAVTANEFQWYIPLFVYTFQKANPNIDIRIGIWGKPDKHIKEKYGDMIMEFQTPTNFNMTANTLRFTIPHHYYKDYEYVYYTDVDFLFLKHSPTLMEYMFGMLRRGGECYAGMRGPVNPKNPEHIIKKWDGNYIRIAGGVIMVSREWYAKTELAKMAWIETLKDELHQFIGLREQDEIVFYRMCKDSGLKTPEQKGCFISGEPYDIKYRDIHLGDFKFDHRWKNTEKMRRKWLTEENCGLFVKLEQDLGWREVCRTIDNPMVNQQIFNLRQHIRDRGIG